MSGHVVKQIVIDIETVALLNVHEFADRAQIKPASNLKKQESIDADIAKKRKALVDKAALHWWTGKIAAIGCAIVGGEGKCFVSENHDDEGQDAELLEERKMLIEFIRYLNEHDNSGAECGLYGMNSVNFDFPFLVGRMMRHDLGIPRLLHRANGDVDRFFGYSSASSQRTKLDHYAWGLGISGKSGTGLMVAEYWKNKEYEKLANYCMDDVWITAEIVRRYRLEYELKLSQEEIDGVF